jgi:RNA polymerase sigma factor (sigma-70 family)
VTESTHITEIFEEYRSLLFAMAYRMLGSFADSEDVLQEVWLRWSRTDPDEISNHRSYLLQSVTRMAIDRMRRIEARRETYVGPWLPEPILTYPDAAERVEMQESVSLAMLIVMETLSPLERVVFVLREVFGFGYSEVAEMIRRTEDAVRQLNRRAHSHVSMRRQRFSPDRVVYKKVTEQFVRACVEGSLQELLRLLAPEVTLAIDANGTAETPRVPLHGANVVAEYFASIARGLPEKLETRFVDVNGLPGAVLIAKGSVYAVVALELGPDQEQVTAVRVVRNPAKFGGVLRAA